MEGNIPLLVRSPLDDRLLGSGNMKPLSPSQNQDVSTLHSIHKKKNGDRAHLISFGLIYDRHCCVYSHSVRIAKKKRRRGRERDPA